MQDAKVVVYRADNLFRGYYFDDVKCPPENFLTFTSERPHHAKANADRVY